MRPAPEMIPVLIDTAEILKGSQKRAFLAKTVQAMGPEDRSGPKSTSAGTG